MSHVTNMALLGVRSFSPDEASYIRFFSPLTLIVGPNGSGKTVRSSMHICMAQFIDFFLFRQLLKVCDMHVRAIFLLTVKEVPLSMIPL